MTRGSIGRLARGIAGKSANVNSIGRQAFGSNRPSLLRRAPSSVGPSTSSMRSLAMCSSVLGSIRLSRGVGMFDIYSEVLGEADDDV
ncbi:hypothetical protein NDN08_004922 [Rhodosorus marinus]|uniref:Uncharacterized protein n=1 Tax=Rhodosorus marinus TaxID=101924 RepID=A0AAV8UIG3_9RHOD|nr:hypothetical protein NDN08_004922 [Rhodosorus marinus]